MTLVRKCVGVAEGHGNMSTLSASDVELLQVGDFVTGKRPATISALRCLTIPDDVTTIFFRFLISLASALRMQTGDCLFL